MQIRDVVWIFSARRANQNKNRQSSLKQIDGKILGALYLFSFTSENTKHKVSKSNGSTYVPSQFIEFCRETS